MFRRTGSRAIRELTTAISSPSKAAKKPHNTLAELEEKLPQQVLVEPCVHFEVIARWDAIYGKELTKSG
jgi:hypothetical protein